MFASKLETTSAFVDFPNDLSYRRVGLVLNPFDYNTTTVCSQNTRSAVKAMIFPQQPLEQEHLLVTLHLAKQSLKQLQEQKGLWFHMIPQLKY